MLNRMREKEASYGPLDSEPWFLYVLECRDGSLYTGITNNLERRLKMHQDGRASRFTRTRLPVQLRYHEPCRGRTQALLRECAVKSLPRAKKVELIQSQPVRKTKRPKKRIPA